MRDALTDVPGLKVGHWTNPDAGTGCTVVLCEQGVVAGVDVRGTAPATRETDLLDPVCMVQEVHAILIGGGSAYGLAAADGVMHWLEEHGHGLDVGVGKVPIVPAACLFDLPFGDPTVRPDGAAGYAACAAATADDAQQGNVGAGTGATVGKILGFARASQGGLGTASVRAGGLIVGALVAVNAFGHVMDPDTGAIIAGARQPGGGFVDTVAAAQSWVGRTLAQLRRTNTTLAVVATNARLDKAGATKTAQMAQDGLARAIRPAHTHFDGDTVFALSTGDVQADLSLVGALAADVLARSIVRGVRAAETSHGIPGVTT